MAYATVRDGQVIGLSDSATTAVEVPQDMPVGPGWFWDGKAFKAPAPSRPWQSMLLDGVTEIEAMRIEDKSRLPDGVNMLSANGERVRIMVEGGWDEVADGDWIVRLRPDATAQTREAVKMDVVTCIRLSDKDAVTRLAVRQ